MKRRTLKTSPRARSQRTNSAATRRLCVRLFSLLSAFIGRLAWSFHFFDCLCRCRKAWPPPLYLERYSDDPRDLSAMDWPDFLSIPEFEILSPRPFIFLTGRDRLGHVVRGMLYINSLRVTKLGDLARGWTGKDSSGPNFVSPWGSVKDGRLAALSRLPTIRRVYTFSRSGNIAVSQHEAESREGWIPITASLRSGSSRHGLEKWPFCAAINVIPFQRASSPCRSPDSALQTKGACGCR